MRTLYFDCFAGASGDMILGALIDIGVDRTALESAVRKLNLADVKIEITDVDRSGITAKHVDVIAADEKQHRHLSDITKIINRSALTDSVKERAAAIFTRLAEAEARVHGTDVGSIHFHEVGAMDAIVDIVGACVGFEALGIERFVSSKINVGSGFVEMAHGRFPVPPPAVAELLKGIPVYSDDIAGELITPTGAAIISSVCESYGPIPKMTLECTGYGAGTRTYDRFPNVLRLLLGETSGATAGREPSADNLLLIETNLDDVSPQILGFLMERTLGAGALDCWFTPIQMKKNRPATLVSILCPVEKRAEISKLLYSETTTLGLRINHIERECLPREFVKVKTTFGEIDVKIARQDGRVVNAMPEYDQVRRLALENQVPFHTVRDSALKALEQDIKASAAEK